MMETTIQFISQRSRNSLNWRGLFCP